MNRGATETIKSWHDLSERKVRDENRSLKMDHSTYRAVFYSLCGVMGLRGKSMCKLKLSICRSFNCTLIFRGDLNTPQLCRLLCLFLKFWFLYRYIKHDINAPDPVTGVFRPFQYKGVLPESFLQKIQDFSKNELTKVSKLAIYCNMI